MLTNNFRDFPKIQQLSRAFTELSGIGTSSAGVCIWAIDPLLQAPPVPVHPELRVELGRRKIRARILNLTERVSLFLCIARRHRRPSLTQKYFIILHVSKLENSAEVRQTVSPQRCLLIHVKHMSNLLFMFRYRGPFRRRKIC